jgi:aryl-alcohol dehydrogenase-like predicted oxidoreductase
MEVSALGFGGAEIGFESASLETATQLLNSALDAGLNIIDTGECYHSSEELIGQAVSGRRKDFYLFTKVGHASGLPYTDWTPELMAASIDRSLARLKTDYVDLIHLHTCSEEMLRKGDVIAELKKAQDAGKTRFIGYSGDNMAAKYAVDCGVFDSLQTSLSIAEQQPITLTLPRAVEQGMAVIAKRPVANVAWVNGDNPPNSPYAQPYWERLQKLQYPFLKEQDLKDSIGTALRFTLSQPGVCTAIVGTKNPARWPQNARYAALGPLPEAEVQAIQARWREVAEPGWTGLS